MKLFISMCALIHLSCGEQDYAPKRFAVRGSEVILPCEAPDLYRTFLRWKFKQKGSDFVQDAGHVFPGGIDMVFGQFNTPPARSEIDSGNFFIHSVEVADEGDYWCERVEMNKPTAYSSKYPVQVYVTPLDPQVTAIGDNTLNENQNAKVVTCSSKAGKPGSRLTWVSGSTPITSDDDIVYKKNAFDETLTDASLDLVLTNPTRSDHKRTFQCIVEHPAYDLVKTGKRILDYTVLVKFHPVNIKIWADLATQHVHCEAEGYPKPTYSWVKPGEPSEITGSSVYVSDLNELPGSELFECTASNGISTNAVKRVTVDELLHSAKK